MVAHLLRLKLTLLRNGLRRSAWQVVALVIGALYGCGAVALAVAGLAALSTADTAGIRTVLVLAGSALVGGWWILPLVAFGVDATLDPARFVTFAIPRRDLLTGLALSGVVGIPGVATAVVVLATALAWWQHPAAALVALPCGVLGLATCVVGSRATTTALAGLVGRRRYREVIAAFVILPLMFLGPLLTALTNGISAGRHALPGVAAFAGWTPWGAVWAIPADVAAGSWAGAGARALVALGTLAGLVLVWDRSLSRALVTPTSAGGAPARGRGLGAFGWLPATPTGAVVARCLTYWRRDPRYAKALIVAPLMPAFLYFSSQGTGGGVLLFTGPIVAFLMGWTISADVAYDGTAFWTHVAAPIAGRVDRTGRVVAAVMIVAPVTGVLVLGSVALTGCWYALPALLGASLGLLLTSLGGASLLSARIVYQVPKPGDNPFASAQGGSMAAVVSQLAGFFAVVGLSLPEIALAVLAVGAGSVGLGFAALVVGVVLGSLLLVGGIRRGGRTLDRRAPELLATMVSFR
jgi:ABC-2 type transport system permease protein